MAGAGRPARRQRGSGAVAPGSSCRFEASTAIRSIGHVRQLFFDRWKAPEWAFARTSLILREGEKQPFPSYAHQAMPQLRRKRDYDREEPGSRPNSATHAVPSASFCARMSPVDRLAEGGPARDLRPNKVQPLKKPLSETHILSLVRNARSCALPSRRAIARLSAHSARSGLPLERGESAHFGQSSRPLRPH